MAILSSTTKAIQNDFTDNPRNAMSTQDTGLNRGHRPRPPWIIVQRIGANRPKPSGRSSPPMRTQLKRLSPTTGVTRALAAFRSNLLQEDQNRPTLRPSREKTKNGIWHVP
jgi:hypothetical protein